MAFNNSEEERTDLNLAISKNQGRDWQVAVELERETDDSQFPEYEFSYPWLLQSLDGTIHLLYTWNKVKIKHLQFNHAWLSQQISRSGKEQ